MPIQAPLFCRADLDVSRMILEALTRRGFLPVDRRSSGRPAACQRQKPTLTSDVTLYDAGLHNRSRNRARNWVHSRIWPSRDYFLSTPSTRKTTIVPLLSLICRTARPAAAPHGPNDCGDLPRSPRSSSALTASPHVRKTSRNLSLHNDAVPRTIQTVSRTSATPVLGGLHYQYFRA